MKAPSTPDLDRRLRVLRLAKVRDATGLSRSMIYQLEAEHRFPKRIRLGSRAVGWLEDEVQQWIAGRRKANPAALYEILPTTSRSEPPTPP